MILIRFSVTFLQLRLSPFVSFFAYVVDPLVFPSSFPQPFLFKERNKKESNRVHRVRIACPSDVGKERERQNGVYTHFTKGLRGEKNKKREKKDRRSRV